ncbi:YkvA family protein [Aquibacillus salsiterrae]|uniref:YkvA family protein n=1 Tax=Aquibacillus salsiterrae TaxID=2950439 RepID=A0A9X4AHK7_9BACI|nr:YkvA family protein [Aquibacillus salsiterrae]MDC3418313.1 YkvA family protein [Aquibacillus salsiterrae]
MEKALTSLKSKARKVKQDIFVLVEAYKHPKTPLFVKLLSIIIVAYAFSPIDLIPDFIPILGYLDDVILIPIAITFIIKLIPTDVLEECRDLVRNSPKEKKKNWIAGSIIILVWVAVLYWVVSLFI